MSRNSPTSTLICTLPVHKLCSAYAEAQELFGGFDFDEFYKTTRREADDEGAEVRIIATVNSNRTLHLYLQEVDDEGAVVSKPLARRGRERTLLQEMEPSDIERGYLADGDRLVVLEDKPERYQLRRVPVTPPENETELKDEAAWILEQAFPSKDGRPKTISDQPCDLADHVSPFCFFPKFCSIFLIGCSHL